MPSLDDLAEPGSLERLASGFTSTEGPIWHPAGQYLLFSDMPEDVREEMGPQPRRNGDNEPC